VQETWLWPDPEDDPQAAGIALASSRKPGDDGPTREEVGDNGKCGAMRNVERCEHEGGSIEDVVARWWKSAGSLASAEATATVRTTRTVA
jgi:hypothetical protein